MDSKSNRRTFLKTTTVAAAGVAVAAGMNSLSPKIWPEEMAFESNGSHWAKSQAPSNPALEEDLEVDVAIVGGGFTGLSAALYLRQSQPSKRVAVLEAKGCGNGARLLGLRYLQ